MDFQQMHLQMPWKVFLHLPEKKVETPELFFQSHLLQPIAHHKSQRGHYPFSKIRRHFQRSFLRELLPIHNEV